jgi:alginate O-acetyltransferase complex protein AlgJ
MLSLAFSTANADTKFVIQGTDGWLYFHEEWISQPKKEKESVDSIIQIVNAFKSKRIPIVVSLTPAKSRIYPNFIKPEDALPKEILSKYSNTLNALTRANVLTVDLYPLLFAESQTQKESKYPIYLRQDSHWSNPAAILAGREVAKFIQTHYPVEIQAVPEQQFELKPLPIAKRYGDLIRFLTETERLDYPQEEYQRSEVSAIGVSTGDALLGDIRSDVFLAGTSYSTPGSGFEDGIKLGLSRDTVNYALGGQGQWEPVRKLVKDILIQKYEPKMIIWEIPERFLYSAPTPAIVKEILDGISTLP